ncbi:hypothetical protein FACS1894201_07340 [Bacteroidia bacterium]|nr:hypothetical protein FACS1894201_07340 [Bacteroidia bacterium]
MSAKILNRFLYCAILLLIVEIGCRRTPIYNTDTRFRLEFSQDSIRFDTIFTSLGSTTAMLKVYNRSSLDVKISTIMLENGYHSAYRLNVSGDTAMVAKDVIIRARDSLMIFIKVTIDPNDVTNPFEVIEHIIFDLGHHEQKVYLSAFGQNAVYYLPTDVLKIPYDNAGHIDTMYIPYSIADCSLPWTNEKPYIIYGYLVVYTGDNLVLEAGTQLYFAPNSGLWVYDGGSLQVNGALHNEVLFTGMRRDADYKNSTGQWDRIWLSAGSRDNQINYAIIQNGKIGLLVDTVANANPTLIIRNSILQNMQSYGLLAQGATIQGENLLINDCGGNLLALTLGGSYSFQHCTFANYHTNTTGQEPAVRLNNYYLTSVGSSVQTVLRPIHRADFTSCVIYGMQKNEIQLDLSTSTTANYRFAYSHLKTDISLNNSHFSDCIVNIDPLFDSISVNNFAITKAASPLKGKAQPGVSGFLLFDIQGIYRPYYPTIGAYEYVAP